MKSFVSALKLAPPSIRARGGGLMVVGDVRWRMMTMANPWSDSQFLPGRAE